MTTFKGPHHGLHLAHCVPCDRPRVVRWLTRERRLVYRRHGCENDNQPIPRGIHPFAVSGGRAQPS